MPGSGSYERNVSEERSTRLDNSRDVALQHGSGGVEVSEDALWRKRMYDGTGDIASDSGGIDAEHNLRAGDGIHSAAGAWYVGDIAARSGIPAANDDISHSSRVCAHEITRYCGASLAQTENCDSQWRFSSTHGVHPPLCRQFCRLNCQHFR